MIPFITHVFHFYAVTPTLGGGKGSFDVSARLKYYNIFTYLRNFQIVVVLTYLLVSVVLLALAPALLLHGLLVRLQALHVEQVVLLLLRQLDLGPGLQGGERRLRGKIRPGLRQPVVDDEAALELPLRPVRGLRARHLDGMQVGMLVEYQLLRTNVAATGRVHGELPLLIRSAIGVVPRAMTHRLAVALHHLHVFLLLPLRVRTGRLRLRFAAAGELTFLLRLFEGEESARRRRTAQLLFRQGLLALHAGLAATAQLRRDAMVQRCVD